MTMMVKAFGVIESVYNGDTGPAAEFSCPDCHQQMAMCEMHWTEIECECGYRWTVSVTAEGYKDDEDLEKESKHGNG